MVAGTRIDKITVNLVCVIGLLALCAACSSGATSGTGGTSSPSTTLTVGAAYAPGSLDPQNDVITNEPLSRNYMGLLVDIKPQGHSTTQRLTYADLQGDLASSITPSPAGKFVTFTLRKGVVSSYGNPLTSEDVKWTFDRAMADSSGVPRLLLLFANVSPTDPVTIVNNLTFRMNLTAPSPILLPILDEGLMGIFDAKEAQAHANAKDPWAKAWLADHVASFGAYDVSAYKNSQSITLAADPHYWQGTAKIKKVIWTAVPDSSVRAELVKGNSLDYGWDMSLTDLQDFRQDSSLSTHLINIPGAIGMLFTTTKPPLNNALVRQAILDALDRQEIAQAVTPGAGTAALGCSSGAVPQSGFAGDGTATGDITKAKQLLAQAGYPHGFTMTLLYSAADAAEEPSAARLVQSELAPLGITVALDNQSTENAYLSVLFKSTQDAAIENTGLFVDDTGFFLDLFFKKGAVSNTTGWSNPAFNTDVQTAMSTDGSARAGMILAACNIVRTQVPGILLVNLPSLEVTAKDVTGIYDYPYDDPTFYDLSFSGS